MDPGELLRIVASRLEGIGVPFFVTGSIATIAYGEPRFTNDIDLVLRLKSGQATKIAELFEEDEFYLAEESVRRAIERSGSFNLIHPSSGLKVDFMVAADTPFNRSRFERVRELESSTDVRIPFASPEDVILKKLEYYREGGSSKHPRDIVGVFAVTGDIDRPYLARWAAELGVEEQLAEVLSSLGEG